MTASSACTAQRSILAVGGVAILGIALMLILLGPGAIPGSEPVNATLDSEIRFYAAVFGGYGAVVLWCVRDIARKGLVVRAVAAVMFAGGSARVLSVVLVGPPHPFFLAMMALELLLPPVVVLLQRRIESDTAPVGAGT